MSTIAIDYSRPPSHPIAWQRLAIASLVVIVTLVLTAWIAFSITMIGHQLFERLPAGSNVQVLPNGVLSVTSTNAAGSVVRMVEPMKPAVIPAVVVPLCLIFAFAYYGVYTAYRKAAGNHPAIGGGA